MNINAMMQQAKKMQEQIEKQKKELSKKEFKVEKQGVTIFATGDKKIQRIDINEALIDPEDKDIIEDLMVIAFNELIEQIEEAEEQIKSSAMPGMPF